MTPEEKAKELIDKFRTNVVMWAGGVEVENENARQCALIVVDEIIEALDILFGYSGVLYDDYETGALTSTDQRHPSEYFHKVKEAIENYKK